MSAELHVLALTQVLDLRHTHLTRQQGARPALPPLADWLNISTLDTDQVELFPIADLAGMSLSRYLESAFDVEAAPLADHRTKLDALGGTVLLVPSYAVAARPRPTDQGVLVVSLPMARRDHSADLPKMATQPMPTAAGAANPQMRLGSGAAILGVMVAALLILLVWIKS